MAQTPGKPTLAALTLGMLAIGILMLLQGLGVVSNSWLNPNPNVPAWVFAVIGMILVLASILTARHTVALSRRTTNILGYGLCVLTWIVTHWLVFFANGARCGAESGGLTLWLKGIACQGLAGVVVILFDLVLLAPLYATLRPSHRT